MADYEINYDDQRFKDVESDKKSAISENEKLYSGMIKDSDGYYQAQIDAAKDWEKKQTELQNQQTDFAIEKIEQQKDQAKKDYTKEQSGAYVDWQKQSNKYGANAEQQAQMGMSNTGFSESSQVSMYNTYQNRVMTARESYNNAILNYNNAIKDARLQNSSVLAEIAYKALQQQLELSLQGFQYKNTLLLEKANKKIELEQMYHDRWQDVLGQINTENALAEEIRQFNESMEWEKYVYNQSRASSGGGGGGGGGSSRSSGGDQQPKNQLKTGSGSDSDLPADTAQSILNLGGPYNASYVDGLVKSGQAVETTSPTTGNTIFVSAETAAKASAAQQKASNWLNIFGLK